jgi:hypothetical protein
MPTREKGLSPSLLIIAAIALAWSVRLHDGMFSPAALAGLTVALLMMLGAGVSSTVTLRTPRRGKAQRRPGSFPFATGANALLAIALIAQLLIQWIKPPMIPATLAPDRIPEISLAVTLGTLFALAALATPARFRLALAACVILTGVVAWAWTIVATRNVYNDVIAFHAEASAAILQGKNPYAMTMPNVYGEGTAFYSPGMVVNGRVQYAYPYPPLSLLCTLGGYALGDVRWGLLAASIATAGMLVAIAASAREERSSLSPLPPGAGRTSVSSVEPGEGARGAELFKPSRNVPTSARSAQESSASTSAKPQSGVSAGPIPRATSAALPGAAIAALFLFAPHAFYVTPLAYTDGYVAAAFALVVLCAVRFPRALPFAFGVFLSTKQYAVIAIPIAPLLIADRWTLGRIWRLLCPAVFVAAALTLPPLLLDPGRYLDALVFVQMRQPFRADSLGYLSLFMRGGGLPSAAATLVGFLALLPAIAFSLWRFPRTPAGFAAAAALVFTIFFAFGRQAFANYYFFVTAALCCAIAATNRDAHRLATADR